MKFKQYLQELSNIDVGQAEEAHEPAGEESSSVDNPRLRMAINLRLVNELNQIFLSPESGIQSVRKVLARYGFSLPALYDADPEGDEVIIELDQFGDVMGDDPNSLVNWDEYNANPNDDDLDGEKDTQYSIYILYYLTDEGHYEFYAEMGDDDRMEELMSEIGDELEEEK
jgi:hypothetical protein